MCPVIGLAEGRRFALGASGGRRILPAVLQMASFLLDHRMSLEDAFHQPRLDVSGPDLVTADERLDLAIDAAARAAACRRLSAPAEPALVRLPTAVLDDGRVGWREGMTEPMQPGPTPSPKPSGTGAASGTGANRR